MGSDQGDVGFVTMGAAAGAGQVAEIGVGMLGYAFMGKAHSNAYRKIGYMTWPPPLQPRLITISGRNREAVAEAARRYGYAGFTTDWREVVADDRIQLFDNGGPNDLHAEPSVAAAESGKHVVCEKPLGRTAPESYETWQRVERTGVKHMCGFNYRFVPAVRLAREMLEAGELGEIYHFRGRYLQEWIADPSFPKVWRLDKRVAGSGALGDLGAHVIDLGRYLVGEIESVTGLTRTFVTDRPGGAVDVDDAFESAVQFAGGAVGTIEASRFCPGRKNALSFEINGSKGSLAFELERLNELQVNLSGSEPGARAQGFRTVLVSEADHPFWEHWWPHGHIIGWEHTFVHELYHLLSCIASGSPVGPHGATFEDGYRVAEVCDAILRSAESGRREILSYRTSAVATKH
jgi:predicted dehydrogenase